jgi:8-oxo-dGTP pyrophosphatase MutT (NUDIX family)
MMRRGQTAKFMPNSYVFPGGLVEKADKEFPHDLSNFHLIDAQPIIMEGYEDDYIFRVAALRELFEEAGILLTFDSGTCSSQLITEKDDPSLSEWRKKAIFRIEIFGQIKDF